MNEDFIEKIKVLDIQDGDIILLKTDKVLPASLKETIWKQSSHYFPKNKLIILDGGMDIEVLRNSDTVD